MSSGKFNVQRWALCNNTECKKYHSEICCDFFSDYDDRVFENVSVSEIIKIVNENIVHEIRFGTSNLKEKVFKDLSPHDTRCPILYHVQTMPCDIYIPRESAAKLSLKRGLVCFQHDTCCVHWESISKYVQKYSAMFNFKKY